MKSSAAPHWRGGCDSSAANCYWPTGLTNVPDDVKLGDVPFCISKSQCEYWKHTQLTLDMIEGSGGTF